LSILGLDSNAHRLYNSLTTTFKEETMLKNVKMYYRQNGKMVCVNLDYADSYNRAIWCVREQVLGCTDNWFDVKGPVMALVQK
jgi:hypothetical protein